MICASGAFILTVHLTKSWLWCCVLLSRSLFSALCFCLFAVKFLLGVHQAYKAFKPGSSCFCCLRVSKGLVCLQLLLWVSLLQCLVVFVCVWERVKEKLSLVFLFLNYFTHAHILFWESATLHGNVKPLIRCWLIAGEPGMVDSDQWALPKISCLVEEIYTVLPHMIFLMMTSEEGMLVDAVNEKPLGKSTATKGICVCIYVCGACKRCRCTNSRWPVASVPFKIILIPVSSSHTGVYFPCVRKITRKNLAALT